MSNVAAFLSGAYSLCHLAEEVVAKNLGHTNGETKSHMEAYYALPKKYNMLIVNITTIAYYCVVKGNIIARPWFPFLVTGQCNLCLRF